MGVFGDEMTSIRKKKWKIFLISLIAVILCGGTFLVSLSVYGRYQMSKIPELSFQEALAYTTMDNEDAVITVGIIQNGKALIPFTEKMEKNCPKSYILMRSVRLRKLLLPLW